MSDETTRDAVAQEASAEVAVADGEAAVERKCATCRAWRELPLLSGDDLRSGLCVRRPPTVHWVVDPDDDHGLFETRWPKTDETEGCFDWLPQEPPR